MGRKTGLVRSARTRQARQAQERAGVGRPQTVAHPGSVRFGTVPDKAAATRSADPLWVSCVRYALIAVVLSVVLWFIVALRGAEVLGVEIPVPTWGLDAAALGPLLVLVRFRRPEDWRRCALESDLRAISTLYLVMAFLGAVLGGYWQLWPGAAVSVAVLTGIRYATRRMAHDA